MSTSRTMLVLWVAMAANLASAADPGPTAQPPGAQGGRSGQRLLVRWVGQDGHDYVGGHNRLEANDIQDIHLVVSGLDPRREISLLEANVGPYYWKFKVMGNRWYAHVTRKKGATAADVWIEPVDLSAGQVGHLVVTYDDGTSAETDFRTRKANPGLLATSVVLKAKWIGQEPEDRTGLGPGVGPDGRQDVRIHVEGLSRRSPFRAIRVESSTGTRWESGLNPQVLNSAEYIPDAKDHRQGDLYFQPDRDLSRVRLRVIALYEEGKPGSVVILGGRCDPKKAMPRGPMPRSEEVSLSARWLGQDGTHPGRPGDAHVVLGGLPRGVRPSAIALTDSLRGAWQFRSHPGGSVALDGEPGTLDVRARPDGRSLDLYFSPNRDTRDETFSARLVASDGRSWHARFAGGPSDLARLGPMPEPSRASARPGDDLQALLDRNGTVVLARGTYRLRHPLVLNRPANLGAPEGATLLFSQDPGDAPWTTAIKVRCSNTTLEGFAVRFEGPIRWNDTVSYGPAIIGMTDNLEPGYNDLKHQVVFRRLDVECPDGSVPGHWVDAPRLYRLKGAHSGAIVGNRLRGGPIEFFHGPWSIVDNEYLGPPAGMSSSSFISGHNVHDLVVRGNRLPSTPRSGKTWRFLVLTGTGGHDRIERNIIEGVGSRDDDTIPWCNAPEIILTESYTLKYEGSVVDVGAGRAIIRVGHPQGDGLQSGDIVSVLDGPSAGQWRRIRHVLDPDTCLLDEPLPEGCTAVSIGLGFVDDVFEGNRIDLRGGTRSDAFVLAGNNFGTRVVGNHLLGGGLAWRMNAFATERPGPWGWSHVPFLGGVIEWNILEDAEKGGIVGVDHSPHYRSNKGRTYMSIALRDNVVRWTEPFLAGRRRKGEAPPPGLICGYRPSLDPSELIITATGNRLEAPPAFRNAAAMEVNAARFNTRTIVDRKYRLPSGDAGSRAARSGGEGSLR